MAAKLTNVSSNKEATAVIAPCRCSSFGTLIEKVQNQATTSLLVDLIKFIGDARYR